MVVVAAFGRSLSLPTPASKPAKKQLITLHVHSTSLPSSSHPLLNSHIHTLRSWTTSSTSATISSANLPQGLDHIGRLLTALHDLLLLQFSHSADFLNSLLDDLLVLIDAHASFRSAAVALRDQQSEARAAVRRRDGSRIAAAVRALRRSEKDLLHIGASIKPLTRLPLCTNYAVCHHITEREIVGILKESVAVMASASLAVFLGAATLASGTAAIASAAVLGEAKTLLPAMSFKRREPPPASEMEERLEGLQQCVEGLEKEREGVFRGFLTARVSLLYLLTPF